MKTFSIKKMMGCLLVGIFLINNIATGQTWTSLSPLPGTAPSIPNMAAVNGKIYIVGGKRNNQPSPTFEYNPATNTWSEEMLAAPNGPLWASAIGYANNIYLMGGGSPYPGQTYNYIFNTDSNKWSNGAALLTGRMYHSAALTNGKIYLMGGQNGDNTSEWYFDEYDIASNTWTRKVNLPNNGAWYCGAAAMGDNVYRIAGGGYSAAMIKNHFDVYSVSSNTWTQKPKFHRGLHAPATVVIDGKIIVLGGYSNGNMDSVWIYNPATEKWSAAGFKLPAPMSYHKAVVVDKCIYVYYEGSLYKHCPDLSNLDTDISEVNFNVYPNPSENGIFTIEIQHEIESLRVYTINGQEINNFEQITDYRNKLIQLSFPEKTEEGIYILKIVLNNNVFTCKLVLANY